MSVVDTYRSQKAEMVKAGKALTKSADRHMQSSCDTARPADMDSCVTINDETVLADRSAVTADQSRHIASQPAVVRDVMSDGASTRPAADNADASETAAKSTSRLFDLVNADSPIAQVCWCHCVCVLCICVCELRCLKRK